MIGRRWLHGGLEVGVQDTRCGGQLHHHVKHQFHRFHISIGAVELQRRVGIHILPSVHTTARTPCVAPLVQCLELVVVRRHWTLREHLPRHHQRIRIPYIVVVAGREHSEVVGVAVALEHLVVEAVAVVRYPHDVTERVGSAKVVDVALHFGKHTVNEGCFLDVLWGNLCDGLDKVWDGFVCVDKGGEGVKRCFVPCFVFGVLDGNLYDVFRARVQPRGLEVIVTEQEWCVWGGPCFDCSW